MSAEQEFREAFERLREGAPIRLPLGTVVSQNNVAREAGKDPTALKKGRFSGLVLEIQSWIAAHSDPKPQSLAQSAKDGRRRNRSLRETAAMFKKERDFALSMLVEADTQILHLQNEIESLKRQIQK